MRTAVLFILSFLLLMACTKEQAKDSHAEHAAAAAEKYTCPMHPQIIQDTPGTCPVCGMDLVKVTASGTSGNDLMLNDTQIRLANITTQKVSRRSVGQTVAINGRITVNEQKSEVISSRAAGRVEKLLIKETGQPIQKGQPLYTLYSETLMTLQQEYLLAKEQYDALGKTEKRYQSFLEAAGKKLMLYGLTKGQVDRLTDRSSLQPRVTFLAPTSGVVTEVSVSEGQYIAEGGLLYKIEDISTLWVEAELYPSETSLVTPGDNVTVRINGDENNPVEAKVLFLSPEYRSNTQITVMRATIDNPGSRYRPGQQAQVYLTHSSKEALALPLDAVIRDGKGAHVYIRTGNNTFRPRMVKTGIESFDQVEITDGISEGDTVAVTGAYLLYSEMVLKKGTDPMAGHHH
jgi:membrane fusion protein, copper/silver efflux system